MMTLPSSTCGIPGHCLRTFQEMVKKSVADEMMQETVSDFVPGFSISNDPHRFNAYNPKELLERTRIGANKQRLDAQIYPFLVICEAYRQLPNAPVASDSAVGAIWSSTYGSDLGLAARSAIAAKNRLKWFTKALQDDTNGKPVQALRSIFKAVDDLFSCNDFAEVDKWLQSVKPADISDNLIVGILSITRPASRQLRSRTKFFNDAWKVVGSRGRNPQVLIGGLKGPEAGDGATQQALVFE